MRKSVLFIMVAILLGVGLQSCDREDNNGDNNGGNNGGGDSGSVTTSLTWVDLGLPSGLLWADRNLGASSAEDHGNYYAWGETAPKDAYDWSTYAYGNHSGELTKYCDEASYGLNGFTDNLTVLQASDDAAAANLGGGARTPTKNEWEELINYTTSAWTSQGGVRGLLLTAANGNSLFLPAAGSRYGPRPRNVGVIGYYWSSTLYLGSPSAAWHFYFYPDHQFIYGNCRDDGFPVRAVRASQH